MQECWRWFGPTDPIPLAHIRQTGATGIVTALHDQPNGAVWPDAAVAARRQMIEAAGLHWSVVESIPIHEDIKTGAPGWETHAQAWAQTLRVVARQGVETVCYNFMPVLDWTRTDLAYPLADGALALRFDFAAYAAFDLFILERPGAAYPEEERAAAQRWIDAADSGARNALTRTIIAGLPGSEESYTLDSLRSRIAAYDGIGTEQLRAQLAAFLEIVLPVAEAEGVRLAIHPDDPPWGLFGLPRVVSTADDLAWILGLSGSPANGVTFCTGSLGARGDNDLTAMARHLGPRIHFAHLRVVKREGARTFHEDHHLGGDVDMVAIIQAVLDAERAGGQTIPMRPDHGHRILTDLDQVSTPGYPAIGRLRGLAELRGIARALATLDHR